MHIVKLSVELTVYALRFQGRSQTSEQDEASFERRRRKPLGGSEGMPPPPEIFEI